MQDGDLLPPYEQGLSTPFQIIPDRVGLGATNWALYAAKGLNVLFPWGLTQFSSPSFAAAENGQIAVITVARTFGSFGAVSVAYATTGGTAVPGVNYSSASGVVALGPGQSSGTFSVQVRDDNAVNGDTTVGLVLGSPSGGTHLGQPSTAVLTIKETDVAGVTVSAAQLVVPEGDRSVYTVQLKTQPAANVAIFIMPAGSSALSTDTSTMVFTPLNWNTPQVVTVSAASDGWVWGTAPGKSSKRRRVPTSITTGCWSPASRSRLSRPIDWSC